MGFDYGGWWVCPSLLHKAGIVYAVGVGTDISFDLGMIERFGVVLHAFDPTPHSVRWLQSQQLPPELVFHEVGLAGYDSQARFYVPKGANHVSHSIVRQEHVSADVMPVRVARLTPLMRQLGHDHIDVLKIDIEGAEYAVIESLLRAQGPIGQLLVEFHHRFTGVGVARAEAAVAGLRTAGYRLFSVADSGEECCFVRRV